MVDIMADMRDYVIGVIGALPARISLPSRPPHALGLPPQLNNPPRACAPHVSCVRRRAAGHAKWLRARQRATIVARTLQDVFSPRTASRCCLRRLPLRGVSHVGGGRPGSVWSSHWRGGKGASLRPASGFGRRFLVHPRARPCPKHAVRAETRVRSARLRYGAHVLT